MATLAVYRGDQFLRRVEVGEAPTRVGRAPENELVLEEKVRPLAQNITEQTAKLEIEDWCHRILTPTL